MTISTHKLGKPRRGRPVNERRREEIVAAAANLFIEHGLHATTMDRIAQKLGISKLTLYSRFENKDALFSAVIESRANEYVPASFFREVHDLPLEESLYRIGYGLLRLVSSGTAVDVERMLMSAAKEKENLTQLFYKAGPLRIRRMVAAHFEQLHKTGRIHAPDALLSTHLFISLFKGSEICMRTRMNIAPKPTKREIDAYCRAAVRMFLASHALKK